MLPSYEGKTHSVALIQVQPKYIYLPTLTDRSSYSLIFNKVPELSISCSMFQKCIMSNFHAACRSLPYFMATWPAYLSTRTHLKIFHSTYFVKLLKFEEMGRLSMMFQPLVICWRIHIPSTNHYQISVPTIGLRLWIHTHTHVTYEKVTDTLYIIRQNNNNNT